MEKIMDSEEDKNVRNDTVTIYEKMRKKYASRPRQQGAEPEKIFMKLPLTARIMEKELIIMLR
jgi:5'-3' exonuclease